MADEPLAPQAPRLTFPVMTGTLQPTQESMVSSSNRSPRHPRCCRRNSAAAGQAMVEFSLVAPLFFFLLFFAVTAGFYTLERASAVNAATAGARIAAGAQTTNLNQPAVTRAAVESARLLASGMP